MSWNTHPECLKRSAEVHLRQSPFEWDAVARHLLERGAVGGDRLLEPGGAGFALPECVFHGYVAIESMNMWPRIPRACGHRFHGMWPPL